MTVLLTVLFRRKNQNPNIHGAFKPSFDSCRDHCGDSVRAMRSFPVVQMLQEALAHRHQPAREPCQQDHQGRWNPPHS